jgi:hypothetical protein
MHTDEDVRKQSPTHCNTAGHAIQPYIFSQEINVLIASKHRARFCALGVRHNLHSVRACMRYCSFDTQLTGRAFPEEVVAVDAAPPMNPSCRHATVASSAEKLSELRTCIISQVDGPGTEGYVCMYVCREAACYHQAACVRAAERARVGTQSTQAFVYMSGLRLTT